MTLEFQEISQGVRDVQQALEDAGYTDLADLLRQVQQQEKEKLHTTLALQALRAAYAHRKFSWQLANGEEVDAGVGGEVDAETGGGHHTCCGGHGGAPHAASAAGDAHDGPGKTAPTAPTAQSQEPSKAEYEAALGESICNMQAIVTGINELLEEVAAAAEEAGEGDS